MLFENAANILAMISSLIAMIFLIKVAIKIGGAIGTMTKLIVAGIFFSVFLHAAVELVATYSTISENLFLYVMGALLTTGSIFFITGGVIALKKLVKA